MLFKYKVHSFDYEDGSKVEQGLVAAKSFSEACNMAVNYYGGDTVIDVTIEPWVDIVSFEEIIDGMKL